MLIFPQIIRSASTRSVRRGRLRVLQRLAAGGGTELDQPQSNASQQPTQPTWPRHLQKMLKPSPFTHNNQCSKTKVTLIPSLSSLHFPPGKHPRPRVTSPIHNNTFRPNNSQLILQGTIKKNPLSKFSRNKSLHVTQSTTKKSNVSLPLYPS